MLTVASPKAAGQSTTEEDSELEAGFDDLQNRSNGIYEDLIAKLSHVDLPELVAGLHERWATEPKSREEALTVVSIFLRHQMAWVSRSLHLRGGEAPSKHQHGALQIRSFMGGRQPGDRCSHVSTGGFTMSAKYRPTARQSRLKLLALPELRELVVEYYDNPTTQPEPWSRYDGSIGQQVDGVGHLGRKPSVSTGELESLLLHC